MTNFKAKASKYIVPISLGKSIDYERQILYNSRETKLDYYASLPFFDKKAVERKAMTTLYLVRHGEAEGNVYRRIQGQYNGGLTPNGYEQIKALVKRFETVNLDTIYTSDLFRAKKTAEAVAEEKNLPIHVRSDLREIYMGIWEDQTWGEMDKKYHLEMDLFCKSSPEFSVSKGETFQELRARIANALGEIIAENKDKTVAVFFHGTAIRYALAHFLNLDENEPLSLPHSDNTAVCKIEIDEAGKAEIIYKDDNSHLTEGLSTMARQSWWREGAEKKLDANLHYETLDMENGMYAGLYLVCRKEAWGNLGRDEFAFFNEDYVTPAKKASKENPYYVVTAVNKNTIVGILQLDVHRYADENCGYIPFFYILPEYRNKGLGVQMIGQAISMYRPMGREKLRLSCGSDNAGAKRFYERNGFTKVDTVKAKFADLEIMEKVITLD